MARQRSTRARGFTLIELMIVISIILILVSIAVPAYRQSVLHAREAVFRQNLFTLRSVISQYTLDKQKAPQSLDDLVQAGYIKRVPIDITGQADTWVTEQEEILDSPDQQDTGISNVHSGSESPSSDGTAYSSW